MKREEINKLRKKSIDILLKEMKVLKLDIHRTKLEFSINKPKNTNILKNKIKQYAIYQTIITQLQQK